MGEVSGASEMRRARPEGAKFFQEVVKRHDRSSSNSSNNALASLRSAVSNPSVNQLYTGASRSWASWRLPCWCQSRARLVAARNSKDLACWLRAISRACWKEVSASAWLSAFCCHRSSPLRRYSSGLYQRSPVVFTSVSASVSAVSPASGCPMMP